ncbi:Zinc finger BED domain-containing protein 1 [Merluccius polli]|uniref:Zinc finger BED domain-containing protein 1 n=1 Tax=Merluccius polli TaxID=89951 RepID=A0AA47MVP5_MERPO|nr:Zinc finger BED domain-containing protein 1 [Merluccius polli]
MKVKCLLCHKELTYSNNTSSMIRHYRAIHENAQSAGSGFRKTTMDEALVNMVVKDSQPFSIVEDVGFKELIHALDPTYILPTRQTLKAMVGKRYEEAKEKAKEKLQQVVSVSLTSDMWTSINMEAYLAVTCHYIDGEDKLGTILLGVEHFPTTHTAENLALAHTKFMEEWGIQDKAKCLVTDAAANMIACVNLLNVRHALCIAHSLNLIVRKSFDEVPGLAELRAKCRKMVTYFRTSTTAKETLAAVQKQMGRPVLKMIIEVDTRWNSTFSMLQRLYEVREPVGAALGSVSQSRKRATYFTALELEVLMMAYADYEHIFRRKSNTAAAAKEREAAWEKIAALVNACNSKGEKRTWQQLKMKHKNIIQNANREKAEARKTGGGPPPPPLTEAEKLALRPLRLKASRGEAHLSPSPPRTQATVELSVEKWVSASKIIPLLKMLSHTIQTKTESLTTHMARQLGANLVRRVID